MAHAVGGFLLTVARQWMTNIYTQELYNISDGNCGQHEMHD